MSYCIVDIPENVRVAYKIFPGEEFSVEYASSGQLKSDWSALYGQFSLSHTLAYLPNHFDRGASSACLVSITTRKTIRCFAFVDHRFAYTSITSATKAQLLRECIELTGRAVNTEKPLLQSIGEDLDMFVVVLDCEEVECAIPHCMMNSDNFSFQTHAIFSAGRNGMLVSNVLSMNNDTGVMESIQVTKDEKSDIGQLINKMQLLGLPECNWLDLSSLTST